MNDSKLKFIDVWRLITFLHDIFNYKFWPQVPKQLKNIAFGDCLASEWTMPDIDET